MSANTVAATIVLLVLSFLAWLLHKTQGSRGGFGPHKKTDSARSDGSTIPPWMMSPGAGLPGSGSSGVPVTSNSPVGGGPAGGLLAAMRRRGPDAPAAWGSNAGGYVDDGHDGHSHAPSSSSGSGLGLESELDLSRDHVVDPATFRPLTGPPSSMARLPLHPGTPGAGPLRAFVPSGSPWTKTRSGQQAAYSQQQQQPGYGSPYQQQPPQPQSQHYQQAVSNNMYSGPGGPVTVAGGQRLQRGSSFSSPGHSGAFAGSQQQHPSNFVSSSISNQYQQPQPQRQFVVNAQLQQYSGGPMQNSISSNNNTAFGAYGGPGLVPSASPFLGQSPLDQQMNSGAVAQPTAPSGALAGGGGGASGPEALAALVPRNNPLANIARMRYSVEVQRHAPLWAGAVQGQGVASGNSGGVPTPLPLAALAAASGPWVTPIKRPPGHHHHHGMAGTPLPDVAEQPSHREEQGEGALEDDDASASASGSGSSATGGAPTTSGRVANEDHDGVARGLDIDARNQSASAAADVDDDDDGTLDPLGSAQSAASEAFPPADAARARSATLNAPAADRRRGSPPSLLASPLEAEGPYGSIVSGISWAHAPPPSQGHSHGTDTSAAMTTIPGPSSDALCRSESTVSASVRSPVSSLPASQRAGTVAAPASIAMGGRPRTPVKPLEGTVVVAAARSRAPTAASVGHLHSVGSPVPHGGFVGWESPHMTPGSMHGGDGHAQSPSPTHLGGNGHRSRTSSVSAAPARRTPPHVPHLNLHGASPGGHGSSLLPASVSSSSSAFHHPSHHQHQQQYQQHRGSPQVLPPLPPQSPFLGPGQQQQPLLVVGGRTTPAPLQKKPSYGRSGGGMLVPATSGPPTSSYGGSSASGSSVRGSPYLHLISPPPMITGGGGGYGGGPQPLPLALASPSVVGGRRSPPGMLPIAQPISISGGAYQQHYSHSHGPMMHPHGGLQVRSPHPQGPSASPSQSPPYRDGGGGGGTPIAGGGGGRMSPPPPHGTGSPSPPPGGPYGPPQHGAQAEMLSLGHYQTAHHPFPLPLQGHATGGGGMPMAQQHRGASPTHMMVPAATPPLPQALQGGAGAQPSPHASQAGTDLSSESRVPTAHADASAAFEISFTSFRLGRLIGQGAFGRVYKAKWRGSDVAVKMLTVSQLSAEVVADFRAEISVLSSLRHPNILLFMGACTQAPHYAIVTELMARGSVWSLLHDPQPQQQQQQQGQGQAQGQVVVAAPAADRRARRAAASSSAAAGASGGSPGPGGAPPPGGWHVPPPPERLDMRLVLRMALDVARGMAYLHSCAQPILHRDLKSGNLLVDEAFNIKISDFGLARVKAVTATMTGVCGTLAWMSPEVLANQRYTEKADVFSYAIVLWELLTRQCPFVDLTPIQTAMGVLNHGLRPPMPEWPPVRFQALIRRCWDTDPAARPDFLEVIDLLEDIQAGRDM